MASSVVAEPTDTPSEALQKLSELDGEAREHKRLSGVHRRRAQRKRELIEELRVTYATLGINLVQGTD